MIAQLYTHNPTGLRVFDAGPRCKHLADLNVYFATCKYADESLSELHLRRRSSWKRHAWGWEAKIRFV
jgi:hypothetical protein